MVEALPEPESSVLEQEESEPLACPQRPRKLFWARSRLPSMGCLVTIFSYIGYKNEIQEIVTSMCRAGA